MQLQPRSMVTRHPPLHDVPVPKEVFVLFPPADLLLSLQTPSKRHFPRAPSTPVLSHSSPGLQAETLLHSPVSPSRTCLPGLSSPIPGTLPGTGWMP